jgi:hypothetical protein
MTMWSIVSATDRSQKRTVSKSVAQVSVKERDRRGRGKTALSWQ